MEKITGTLFSYSYYCDRKVWYNANGISMESNHENVKIGKKIDEESYRRENKSLLIDDCINIDFFKEKLICEVKKSSSQKEMAIAQIKYYLYVLNQKEITDCEGKLCVPSEKYTEKVVLEDGDIEKIEKQIKKIEQVVALEVPPEIKNKSKCAKCSFFELCHI